MPSVKHYPPEGFTKRLYETWINSGLDMTVVSKASGISRSSLYSYVMGGFVPNATALASLCKVFNVSADYLLFGD